MNRKQLPVIVAFVCLLPLYACGPKAGTLRGKVTFKDIAFNEGEVQFLDKTNVGHPPATIDADGKYEAKNLPYGEYRIAIKHMPKGQKSLTDLRKEWKAKGSEPPPDEIAKTKVESPLPAKYADNNKSGLTVTISQPTTEFNIKLVDEGN
jgi:hypothetical protein